MVHARTCFSAHTAPSATSSTRQSSRNGVEAALKARQNLTQKPKKPAEACSQESIQVQLPKAVLQAAHGATLAAASAAQSLWDSREDILRPSVSELQLLLSTAADWLQRTDGGDNGQREQSTGTLATTEADELRALELLREQADSNAAIQLLRQRASDGSRPGHRKDKAKLGLIVEGGGMRGAVSGGALQALHDLGLRDCIDVVYGSSAGAINATYFLSGQREGVDIYSQDIANTTFIDLRRLLRRGDGHADRPALDLSFLLDYVMNEVKELDWQAVVSSPIPLKVVASCLDTVRPVLLSEFASPTDLRECLRAGAAVPEVAGPPVVHRGRRLVDAAVFEAIPFRAAIADGCTHILALPTRPPYRRGDMIGKLIDETVATVVKRAVLSPAYMREAWIQEVRYQRSFASTPEELLLKSLQADAHKLPGMAGCHVFPFFPGPAASYSPLCTDAATIMMGIAEGRTAVEKILGKPALAPAVGRPRTRQAPAVAKAIAAAK